MKMHRKLLSVITLFIALVASSFGADITPGYTFVNGELVTAAKLNTFGAGAVNASYISGKSSSSAPLSSWYILIWDGSTTVYRTTLDNAIFSSTNLIANRTATIDTTTNTYILQYSVSNGYTKILWSDILTNVAVNPSQFNFIGPAINNQELNFISGAIVTNLNSRGTGVPSILVSTNGIASGSGSVGIGPAVTSGPGAHTVAIGDLALATNVWDVAVGYVADAYGGHSLALGASSLSSATNGTAVGYSASATAANGSSLGNSAQANGANSTALGATASVGGFTNATALGYAALNTTASQLMHGTSNETSVFPGPVQASTNWVFTSGTNNAVPANSAKTSIAHNFGAKPQVFRIVFVCQATEGGYAVGDELSPDFMEDTGGAGLGPFSIYVDSTNINVARRNANTASFVTKGGGVAVSLTAGNWSLKAYAVYWR